MKMQPAHYQHIEQTIKAFESEHADACKAHKASHNPTRYAWDIFTACKLTPYLCDTLYKYLDDKHVTTALLKITKNRCNYEN